MSSLQREKWSWWAGGVCTAFGVVVVILIFTGVVGPGLWWTVAGVGLVALSTAITIVRARRART